MSLFVAGGRRPPVWEDHHRQDLADPHRPQPDGQWGLQLPWLLGESHQAIQVGWRLNHNWIFYIYILVSFDFYLLWLNTLCLEFRYASISVKHVLVQYSSFDFFLELSFLLNLNFSSRSCWRCGSGSDGPCPRARNACSSSRPDRKLRRCRVGTVTSWDWGKRGNGSR